MLRVLWATAKEVEEEKSGEKNEECGPKSGIASKSLNSMNLRIGFNKKASDFGPCGITPSNLLALSMFRTIQPLEFLVLACNRKATEHV